MSVTEMKNQTIGIIDYGVCNVSAIIRMLSLLSVRTKRVVKKDDFKGLDKLILPGIGAFTIFLPRECSYRRAAADWVLNHLSTPKRACQAQRCARISSSKVSSPTANTCK